MSATANVVAHEAGHCAGLLWLGRLPTRVVVAPYTSVDVAGEVEPASAELDRRFAIDLLLACVLGPLSEVSPRGEWPPPFAGLGEAPAHPAWANDQRKLAMLTKFLRLSEVEYDGLVSAAKAIGDLKSFRDMRRVIERGLSRVGTLSGDDLRFLLGAERCSEYLDGEGD